MAPPLQQGVFLVWRGYRNGKAVRAGWADPTTLYSSRHRSVAIKIHPRPQEHTGTTGEGRPSPPAKPKHGRPNANPIRTADPPNPTHPHRLPIHP
ncbi:hypothetical protein ZWY2020_056481 [Hordeum vulgare]|nr:hypothetical protein ZWY2020_056481 [Hordeum vulgare]